ncbi:BQ2448_6818 [Microbotryum intermedium]|uniref:BQ2448_6818 protein n=1 Tax=Microbotryum intermedium TaxID=269621 RepID=A0A238FTG9_9BASI|nr:BQ2448_6818 [Microbotryum intermedium]
MGMGRAHHAQQTSTLPPKGTSSTSSPPPPPPPPSSDDLINQAHTTLSSIQAQLDHLSTSFDLNPSNLVFTIPPTPDLKLAFVPQNALYHSYVEDLTKLLLRLDGVDSSGDITVRNRRKALVRSIEAELEKLERVKKG